MVSGYHTGRCLAYARHRAGVAAGDLAVYLVDLNDWVSAVPRSNCPRKDEWM